MPEKIKQNLEQPEKEELSIQEQLEQKEQELFEVLGVETKEEAKEVDVRELSDEVAQKAYAISQEIGGLKEREAIKGTFEFDQREDGWELERDSDDPGPINIEDAELVEPQGGWWTSEHFTDMADKALGQRSAEYLVNNQDKIPESWRAWNIYFLGTKWRGLETSLIPLIKWREGRWEFGLKRMDRFLESNDRFIKRINSIK